MLNVNQTKWVIKKKSKEVSFKPEVNQPIIKSVIGSKEKRKNSIVKTNLVQKVKGNTSAPNTSNTISKKRDPPTPPKCQTPSKRPNMSASRKEEEDREEMDTGDNQEQHYGGVPGDNNEFTHEEPEDQTETAKGDSGQKPKKKKKLELRELSPELQYLRELLQEDMQEMLIKPLEDRMTKLETAHRNLEEQGESINDIVVTNRQLHSDCDLIKKENEDLKKQNQQNRK